MKKLLKKAMVTMCSAVVLMGIGIVSANAATVEVGDFTVDRSYSYGSYTTKIKSYNGKGGDITLPTTAEFSGTEYPITTVGAAFNENEVITGVTIPEGYTDIDTGAFASCTSLTSVSIPGSVDSISSQAFKGCSALKDIDFADDTASSLTIRNDAFTNCTSLTSIELPARLSSATSNFLRGCTSLVSLSIKDGANDFTVKDNILYDISGDNATMVVYPFGKNETEFTIPAEIDGKAVTKTAMHLFRANPTLKKVTVPSSVTNLGGYTFSEMPAIEKVILETETVPTLGSEVCTNMASGSKVVVKNENVAAAFESSSPYTTYYTSDNTTITVEGADEEKNVSATLSVSSEPKIKDGKAIYSVYLDNAENLNTLLLKIVFDSSQVNKGEISIANEKFTTGTSTWSEEDGKLILKTYMGITGNVAGITSDEKTKLAEISVPIKDGSKGNISAEITTAKAAGVVGENESAMTGNVILSNGLASVFLPSYDVNNDGNVDIIDITEAQRYYRATSADEIWTKAKTMDVNSDNTVDIQDYIDIFNNLSDF